MAAARKTNTEKIGKLNFGLIINLVYVIIVSIEGGWFGSSIVFQDNAMVMLLYWKKCLLLVGERKF